VSVLQLTGEDSFMAGVARSESNVWGKKKKERKKRKKKGRLTLKTLTASGTL